MEERKLRAQRAPPHCALDIEYVCLCFPSQMSADPYPSEVNAKLCEALPTWPPVLIPTVSSYLLTRCAYILATRGNTDRVLSVHTKTDDTTYVRIIRKTNIDAINPLVCVVGDRIYQIRRNDDNDNGEQLIERDVLTGDIAASYAVPFELRQTNPWSSVLSVPNDPACLLIATQTAVYLWNIIDGSITFKAHDGEDNGDDDDDDRDLWPPLERGGGGVGPQRDRAAEFEGMRMQGGSSTFEAHNGGDGDVTETADGSRVGSATPAEVANGCESEMQAQWRVELAAIAVSATVTSDYVCHVGGYGNELDSAVFWKYKAKIPERCTKRLSYQVSGATVVTAADGTVLVLGGLKSIGGCDSVGVLRPASTSGYRTLCDFKLPITMCCVRAVLDPATNMLMVYGGSVVQSDGRLYRNPHLYTIHYPPLHDEKWHVNVMG